MLAKLIALDLRFYRKMLWKPLLICLMVLIGSIAAASNTSFPDKTFAGLGFVVGTLTILVAIGFIVFTMVAHYYRHFYSAQGYLTHTLPATPSQRLWAKLISGFFLHLISLFIIFFGLYLLTRASLGPFYSQLRATSIVQTVLDYLGWPAVFLIVGLMLFAYPSFFAAYSLSISLGLNKRLQRFGGGGIAIVIVGQYLFNMFINFVSSKIPLSLRIYLNPRWYKMIQLVTERPVDSVGGMMEGGVMIPASAYVDIGFVAFMFSFVFIVISFLLVHRELKRINLR